MNQYKLRIGHVYPEILNLYGDKGNVISLQKRCEWRNIEIEVEEIKLGQSIEFNLLDIIFLGGGSDMQQLLAYNHLKQERDNFIEYVEDNGTILAVCGSYPMLGAKYILDNQEMEGLHLLDIYTKKADKRFIGNIIIESNLLPEYNYIVGFENHGERTYINNYKPLGYVKHGHGNNDTDNSEGVIYKNTIGTYMHGPLLPKNPGLTDHIIASALQRKYPENFENLQRLNDSTEIKAQQHMIDILLK